MNSHNNVSTETVPLTDTYVQEVPDKCDRIIWRGQYYHLPIGNAGEASAKDGVRGERWYATATGQTSEDVKHELYTLTRQPFPLSDYWTLVEATTGAGLVDGEDGEQLLRLTRWLRVQMKSTEGGLDGSWMRWQWDTYRNVLAQIGARDNLEAAIGREVGNGN